MKILAIEKEIARVTADQFQPHLKVEAAKVWELYQAGVIREPYFRGDRTDAILVLERADAAEANRVLGALLLVKEELITFAIIPLKPYPGFSRLFPQFAQEAAT